jgi:hypothetical protein
MPKAIIIKIGKARINTAAICVIVISGIRQSLDQDPIEFG